MNRRGWRAPALLVLGAAALLAIAVIGWQQRDRPGLENRPPRSRPTLLLVTSLPLMFGEGFSIDDGGSAALDALERRYTVVPINVTDPPELAQGRLLLMAHPLAQPAEDLVALDNWVRDGGRVMLLADPLLEWPSKLPLGDPLRPPPMFMDTGLLGHWGLRLDAPDQRGPAMRMLGANRIETISPGQLFGRCAIAVDRLVARCRIGKGRATIIADADFLNAGSRRATSRNLDGLLAELDSLEHS